MIEQKNVIHIVKHQNTQKERVQTLLDRPLLVINYVSFRTNYLMYHSRVDTSVLSVSTTN